jgi:hypothetical protein
LTPALSSIKEFSSKLVMDARYPVNPFKVVASAAVFAADQLMLLPWFTTL